MTREEEKELAEDCKAAVSTAMQSIHKRWDKRVPVEELRLIVCRLLADRAFECAIESVGKSMRGERKINSLITLLKVGHTPSQAAQLTEEAQS